MMMTMMLAMMVVMLAMMVMMIIMMMMVLVAVVVMVMMICCGFCFSVVFKEFERVSQKSLAAADEHLSTIFRSQGRLSERDANNALRLYQAQLQQEQSQCLSYENIGAT